MNKSELRCRIEGLEHLPMLPHMAAQVLALPLSSVETDPAVAELISADPCLTVQILRAANAAHRGGDAPVTRVDEALSRLGPGLVHSTLLGIALSTVTDSATGASNTSRSFWTHCVACGVCAELIAERIGSAYKPNAFVAGLLHDIGKIVLELVAPEAYAQALETAARHDLFILEAERQELGIDHALIGKWLAERWDLPELFTDVIWLHHHEPGTLDATQYPVELIELVNLANTLSHECVRPDTRRGRRGVVTDEQLQRLNLSRAVYEDIRAQAARKVADRLRRLRLDSDETLSTEALQKATRELLLAGVRFDEQSRRAHRELHQLRILHEFNGRMRPRQSLRDVVDHFVDALRRGLGLSNGACIVADARERLLLGKRWRDLDERPRDLQVSLEPGAGGTDLVDPWLMRSLHELAFKRNDKGWVGATVAAPVQRDRYLVVPMRAEGRTLGHVVVETPPDGTAPGDMPGLTLFAEAGARAVARQRAEMALEERTEDLAAALWKKEIAFKKELQAERTNSEANVAAGAAHALSRYLADITLQAQRLLHRRRGDEDAEPLGAIVRQSRQAHKVLEDLIAFARTPLPKLEPILIHFVLHQLVAQHRDRLESENIHVVEKYAEGLPRVMVDRHQVVQAVTELIKNAEDAMRPQGGGMITVETAASPDRRYVTIAIADTGPGIPAGIRDRVYEPFFTTHDARDRLGLGLPLCHRIVEKHRGILELEADEGRGARFVLTFPSTVHLSAQRTQPAPAEPVEKEEHLPLDAPTILIVDDEEQLCRALRDHLRNRGYRVETAGDGLAALGIISTTPVDLVLLDMYMPTRDGLSVLSELHERFSSVPVIVMTGMAEPEEVENALRLGARSCLSKPFETEHLLEEIEMVLSKRPRKLP